MRVPPKGTNIKVQVPVVKADRPGGIGLAELNGLLHSRNFDWEEGSQGLYGAAISPLGSDTSTPTRTVELIVQPASTSFRSFYLLLLCARHASLSSPPLCTTHRAHALIHVRLP